MKNEELILLTILNCKGFGNKKALDIIMNNNYKVEKIKDAIIKVVGEEEYKNASYTAQSQISQNEKYNIQIISLFDKRFPKSFLKLKNPIIYLFYKGNIELIFTNSIAIIGSRNVNLESLKKANMAGQKFAEKLIPVVSGLALGIDEYAHQGVMKIKGKAIGVLPSDLINITPKKNKSLANEILENGGCLVSEYSVGKRVDKFCFVKRDRIQSAIASVILVIDANNKSGTINAVKSHLECKKEVYQLKESNIDIIENKIELTNENVKEICDKVNNCKINKIDLEHEQLNLFQY